MSEKKEIKIGLSTFFLIIAIIAIIGMGIFIFKLIKDKDAETQKTTELQAKVDSLNKNMEELQKELNKPLERVTKDENVVSTNSTKEVANSNLSEEEAQKLLKEKFDIIEKIYLEPNEFFNVSTAGEEITDFESTILKYCTQSLFEEIKNDLPWSVRLENGKYYFGYSGGARKYTEFGAFENIKVTDTSITATLRTKQMGPNAEGKWATAEDKTSEIKLVKEGNDWLVDQFKISDINS